MSISRNLSKVADNVDANGVLAVSGGGTGATTNSESLTSLGAQSTLVSGTNIKTINNTSLLGSGNIAAGDVTLTGVQTLTNKTFTGYTETVYALGTSGSLALNPANGTVQTCAASGTITFTDSFSSGQSIVLMLTNGSTYTINYPTITWVGPTGNVAPTLNAANTLVFWKVGTTLYGAHVGKSA